MAGSRLQFFPRLTGGVLRLVARCIARVEVNGLEKLPASGAGMVIANHASNADGMLLMAYVVPRMGRRLTWLGKEEALRWPVLGWTMKQNGVIGVRRGAGDLEAFKTAKKVLDDGGVLGIFPEGTRSFDGCLAEAKEGATVLALRSGVPIIPVAIAGTHRLWPRGKFLPRPGKRISVTVGEPFVLHAAHADDRHEAIRASTRALMLHIAEMLPPEQRGFYGDAAGGPAPGVSGAAGGSV